MDSIVFDGAPSERYRLTWAGKREAIELMQKGGEGTLLPVPMDSIAFETTQHVFIEGDNLEVLKLLNKPYLGRVPFIYIDPPYNSGGQFVYPDNFASPLDTYLKLTGQKDGSGNLLGRGKSAETNGRYHSNWLSMMYPRLSLARMLLRDDGVIFISIDDHEVHNLRLLMNEIFSEENFIGSIVWQKKQSPQNDTTNLSDMHDYILVYAKKARRTKSDEHGWERQLLERTEEQEQRYANPDNDPRGDWASVDYTCNKSADERPNLYYPIIHPRSGRNVWPSRNRVWGFERATHEKHARENRLWWGSKGDSRPRLKRFRSEVQEGVVPSTWWDRVQAGDNQEAKRELRSLFDESEEVFDTPKPVRLIKKMLSIATARDEGAIIMDFFAGSGTTAQAVLELNREDGGNRRFILVQLPEPTRHPVFPTIADLCEERIRRVIKKMELESNGMLELFSEDLGFKVFKLVSSNYRMQEVPEIQESQDFQVYLDHLGKSLDPLVEGWTVEGVIWEVALKEGFCLNSRIEHVEAVTANHVYRVTDPEKDQTFFVCLDDKIYPPHLGSLNLKSSDVLICRDSALDDSAAANLTLQCILKVI
jgi:adenine-specific DNA-methyltransferase